MYVCMKKQVARKCAFTLTRGIFRLHAENQRAYNKNPGSLVRHVAGRCSKTNLQQPGSSEKALILRATAPARGIQVRVCRQVPTALTSSTAPYK